MKTDKINLTFISDNNITNLNLHPVESHNRMNKKTLFRFSNCISNFKCVKEKKEGKMIKCCSFSMLSSKL